MAIEFEKWPTVLSKCWRHSSPTIADYDTANDELADGWRKCTEVRGGRG